MVETLTNEIVLIGYGVMSYALGNIVAAVWEGIKCGK